MGTHEQTIVKFDDEFFACAASPDPGTSNCRCSRCGGQIAAGLLPVTVRFNQPQPHLGYPSPGEWRYCRSCVPADFRPQEKKPKQD